MWEEEQAEVPRMLKPFLDFGVFMLRGLGLYVACFCICYGVGRLFVFAQPLCFALVLPGIFLARHLPPPLVESNNCGGWFCGLGQMVIWSCLFDLALFSSLFGGLYVACQRVWLGKPVD